MAEARDIDPKAMFYLENRDDIEEWAGLRDGARVVVERHLLDCVDSVHTLAVEQEVEVYDRDLDGGAYPRTGLTRIAWRHAGSVDVAVVLGWQNRALLKPGSENEWPYVGVRMSHKQKDVGRREDVSRKLLPLKNKGYLCSRVTNAWPLWKPVEPAGPQVDPAELAEQCVRQLQQLWSDVAPVLDGLHA